MSEPANVIDLATVHAGDVPARCWESLRRIQGWSAFVRPDGVPDGDETA